MLDFRGLHFTETQWFARIPYLSNGKAEAPELSDSNIPTKQMFLFSFHS